MTDLDIIKNSINTLGKISIPAEYVESIAIPIYNVRQELIILYNSVTDKIKQAEEEKAKAEKNNAKTDNDPSDLKIRIVSDEETAEAEDLSENNQNGGEV